MLEVIEKERLISCTHSLSLNPSLLPLSLPLPQVSKERVRVLEFMRDYDKLRSGRIPVTSFRRSLDLCRFPLSQEEVAVLEQRCVLTV